MDRFGNIFSSQLASIRGFMRGLVGLICVLFLIDSDQVFSIYLRLPWQETWSGVVIVGVAGALLIFSSRRWPKKIRPHREFILERLGEIRFATFAFVFTGFAKVFYELDRFLILFYTYPGPWIMFGFQAILLTQVAALQYPQLNLASRLGTRGVRLVWNLISRYRRRK